ncbi:Cyclin-like protein [Globisporangium polare]
MAVDKWVFPELRAHILQRSAGPSSSSSTTDSSSDSSEELVFQTASLVESGIPWGVEQQLRRTTCSFIEDLASLVEIPDAPTVAAQLYVQRFYVLHSFRKHDRFLVATAALFLAAKTEEFPIKVRLLTECALYLLHCKQPGKEELLKKSRNRQNDKTTTNSSNSAGGGGNDRRGVTPANKRKNASGKPVEMSASLGNNPEAANAKHLDCLNALLEVSDVGEVETTSAKVLLLERILLQTISFDVGVPQPFAYVARHMEKLFALDAMHPSIPYDTVRVIAFLLLADAIKSGLCLAFNSPELAAGAVYLSCLYRNSVTPNVATETNAPWWSVFGLSSQQLEDVSRSLLWMFEDASGHKISGVSVEMQRLWGRYRPEQNLPDLEYIKKLDADLQS